MAKNLPAIPLIPLTQTDAGNASLSTWRTRGFTVVDNLNPRSGAPRLVPYGRINYWIWLVGAPAAVLLMMLLSRL